MYSRYDAETVRERNLSLMAAQVRVRRGPTPEAFFTKRIDNSRLVTADDPVRAREMRSFAGAMAVLFVLIMIYGWQHFSAIEYGYRIEAEKQQIEQLNEQNRELRLTEAQLGSPARIDVMAKQMGLAAPAPGQVVRPEISTDSGAPVLAQATPPIPASPTDRR
jgi:cell division protein FtsL